MAYDVAANDHGDGGGGGSDVDADNYIKLDDHHNKCWRQMNDHQSLPSLMMEEQQKQIYHQYGDANMSNDINDTNRYYDSDQIDSDVEELLYSSIHHQTIDSVELAWDNNNVSSNKIDESVVNLPISSPISTPVTSPNHDHHYTSPHSVVLIKNQRKMFQKSTKNAIKSHNNIEVEENLKSSSMISTVPSIQLDISYGNTDNMAPFDPYAEMNRCYNEDSYDSEEEAKKYKNMPSDRRFWRVDQEDWLALMRKRSLPSSSRNNGGNGGHSWNKCKHCNSTYHTYVNCPKKPKICYLCGLHGHLGSRCPNLHCNICDQPGHLPSKCKQRYRVLRGASTCPLCKLRGHQALECTLQWRKFLTITNPTVEQLQEIQNTKMAMIHDETLTVNVDHVSCYNCGSVEHYAFECNELTINNRRKEIPPPVGNRGELMKLIRKARKTFITGTVSFESLNRPQVVENNATSTPVAFKRKLSNTPAMCNNKKRTKTFNKFDSTDYSSDSELEQELRQTKQRNGVTDSSLESFHFNNHNDQPHQRQMNNNNNSHNKNQRSKLKKTKFNNKSKKPKSIMIENDARHRQLDDSNIASDDDISLRYVMDMLREDTGIDDHIGATHHLYNSGSSSHHDNTVIDDDLYDPMSSFDSYKSNANSSVNNNSKKPKPKFKRKYHKINPNKQVAGGNKKSKSSLSSAAVATNNNNKSNRHRVGGGQSIKNSNRNKQRRRAARKEKQPKQKQQPKGKRRKAASSKKTKKE